MGTTLDEILADNKVSRDEIDAIFQTFDADGSGKLERDELVALAAMLAKKIPGTNAELLMQVMDFYELDHDGAMDRTELHDFLRVQLDL